MCYTDNVKRNRTKEDGVMTNNIMTISELELRNDCDAWDLWDSMCNYLPMAASFEECAEFFAKTYNVDTEEVKEYFCDF
jgi:hypothetical protein